MVYQRSLRVGSKKLRVIKKTSTAENSVLIIILVLKILASKHFFENKSKGLQKIKLGFLLNENPHEKVWS